MNCRQLSTLAIGVGIGSSALWLFSGMRDWERTDPLPRGPVELVVVLSSGVAADSQLDGAALERLRAGIVISRALRARLVTTRTIAGNRGPTSDYGQRLLIEPSGLSPRWTRLAGIVRSTRDEALALRAAFPGNPPIVVLTSRFHTRRACAVFEQTGFVVTCRAAPRRPRSVFGELYDYLYERLAWWKYRYNGWIGRGLPK